MTLGQHGGGIPFLAERTIYEMGDDFEEIVFHAPERLKRDAEIRAVRWEDSDNPDRTVFRLEPGEAARDLLEPLDPDKDQDIRASANLLSGSTAKFYYRIFDARGKFESHEKEVLEKIAGNMSAASGSTTTMPGPAIPAIYTYFGQFIAHDLTHMQSYPGDPGMEWNLRSHVFDLDSIFASLPVGVSPLTGLECMATLQPNHICLGPTSLDRHEDIARTANGFPFTTDPRCDNNLIAAQLFVAITRFIWRLQECYGFATLEELQAMAARYLQSIALNDYLPAVCDDGVVTDLLQTGQRKVIFPAGDPVLFQVPVEFAAACFRFGHSMVNSNYLWNDVDDASLNDILNNTHLGNNLSPQKRLIDNWVIDWDKFATAEAKPIDTRIANRLNRLSSNWIDPSSGVPYAPDGYNLAFITLWRAVQLELATAQQLKANLPLLAADHASTFAAEDIFPSGHPICAGLTAAQSDHLNTNTPLWLYVLREAEKAGTGKLGPFGSRIVAETIHAAIAGAQDSILSNNNFQVTGEFCQGATTQFTLNAMLGAIHA